MEPCLAATGADPTLPIVLAAALLALGAVIALVAIRRGKAGAALLVLALPFLVGASLLGSASPALAQPGVPCPTPTPTPTCEPAEPIDDLEVLGDEWILNDSGTGYQSSFTEADGDALEAIEAAIEAIDPDAAVTLALWAQVDATQIGPVPAAAGEEAFLDTEELTAGIDSDVFEELIGDTDVALVWLVYTITYDDGCGGILVSEVTYTAPFGDLGPQPEF